MHSSQKIATDAEQADDHFFAALVAADAGYVSELLADDFLLVDVFGGAVIDRDAFIASVESNLVRFESITVAERATRRYADVAVIVGRTELIGSFDGAGFEASSRYTHVLVRTPTGSWRLVSAQGTRIPAEPLGSDE